MRHGSARWGRGGRGKGGAGSAKLRRGGSRPNIMANVTVADEQHSECYVDTIVLARSKSGALHCLALRSAGAAFGGLGSASASEDSG